MAYRPNARIFSLFVGCFFLILPNRCYSDWKPEDCPSFCECFMLYDLRWTECAGRRLYSIHTGVNGAVQALDVSNNTIASLADYELTEAGLTNLKLLNLSSNAISLIGMSAFEYLTELRVLDLSYNHLYHIQTNSFVNNRKLEILELGGNNFNGHVPKLQSVSLASLGLASCRISHLPTDTFEKLPRLRAIDLSNNMMILLEPDVLLRIPYLAILILERNPWFCNNNMFELQRRLKHKGVKFKDICIKNNKSGPKKFEKMIALNPTTKATTVYVGAGRMLTRINDRRNSWKIETTSNRDSSKSTAASICHENLETSWKTLRSCLFVTMGFLAGASVATVATYLWMSREISQTLRNLRRRTMREDLAQRMSLLQNLWQNNENANRVTTDCPGTPPPPYRDVMQHSRRYPRPQIQAIVFANDTSLDDRRRAH